MWVAGNTVANLIVDILTDVSRFFGRGNISHIAAVCRGTGYTSYCHIFRYVDDERAVETKISVPELPHTSLDQIKRKDYDTFRSAGQQLAAEEIVQPTMKIVD